ncbi:MAG: hypothetical protein HPY57_15135 [Ignavibacteria bacterium]|nr:hypothetical protein [Ignavibacteria bacterium]
MEKLYEIYQECGFNNKNILDVANSILNIVGSAEISKNEDNEIVISFSRNKNKIILLIDKFADIQYIRKKDDDYIYKVYYFADGFDYQKVIKGL